MVKSSGFSSLIILLLINLAVPSLASAERYKVSEDSFGELDATKIEGNTVSPQESVQAADDPVDIEQALTSVSDNEPAEIEQAEIEQAEIEQAEIEQAEIEQAEIEQAEIEQAEIEQAESAFSEIAVEVEPEPEIEPEEKPLSVFEQKYLENIERERKEVLDLIRRNEAEDKVDVTDISNERFVDGDELEESAISDSQIAPFFVEIGADGKPRVTAYDPALEKAFRKSQQEEKLEFTDATIFKRSQEEKSFLHLQGMSQPDPKAKDILFGNQKEFTDYFTEFSKDCCEDLINKYVETLEKGRAYFFEISEDDLPFRFKEGDSRYLLIKLPRTTHKNYPLRLRTFIRNYKDQGISHGAFFPQIVTLDKDKRPLRIITGPLLKYVPETWTKYGYLEGVFEIDQTRENEETYLLAKTSKKILKETSSIISDDEEVTIQHLNFGSFEVEILLD